jgi:hypothetical protein
VRRIAVLWTTACIAPVLLYGLFTRAPEPQLGLGLIAYTLPAAAVLAAALPGALLAPDGRSRPTVNRGQLVPLLLLVLIGALRLHEGALQARPADSTWLDAFSERGAQQLPAHALLLFQDAARAHAQQAVEHETQTRPDLQRLPLSALQHGTRDAALLENDADLRGLLRAYLLEGELSTAELQSLAARRSVALDIDARVSPVLYPALRPSHLFYEVADAQVSPAEQHAASTALHDDLGALRDLARAESHDTGTRERLSELAWCVALYFAGRGARDEARATIADARELTPTHSRWDALSALLAAPPEHGPVDVHTLLPDSAEPLSPSR